MSSTWGAGRVQADVELVSVIVSSAKQALQAAHFVLLEGLIQVAAYQAHCTGLDHLPAGRCLHLHALLGLLAGQHHHGAAVLVVGWRGLLGWGHQGRQGVMQLPAQVVTHSSSLCVIPVMDRVSILWLLSRCMQTQSKQKQEQKPLLHA